MVSKKAEGVDTEDEQTRVFGFRTAYVFDLADTEGEELPRAVFLSAIAIKQARAKSYLAVERFPSFAT